MVVIRLRREHGKQTRRGDFGSAPATSPTAQHGGSGAQGEIPPLPLGSHRDFLDDVDLAVAEVQYEKWLNR